MNVLSRLQVESGIRLAEMPAMTLGALTITPGTLEVAGPKGAIALEPRCMKVLVVLHEHLGRTVSRDVLIDRCWDGRIVTDGALNRCVAQIRRALAADPQLAIDTVPRIGYRLRSPERPAATETHEPAPLPVSRPRRWVMAGAAAVLLVVCGVWVYVWLSSQAGWRGDQVRPLTSEPGVESYPAMAPDGARLAYAKAGSDGTWDIFIKNVDGTGLRSVTRTPANEIWPSWRGDGQALAFIRTGGGRCEIVTLDVITMAEAAVTSCDPARAGRPSWIARDRLIYSDAAPATDQRMIFRLDLNTRTRTPLSTPPILSHGDMDPVASPDGRRLVFRRTQAWGVDDLMVGDLTGEGLSNLRAVTNDGWKSHGVTWSSDSRDVIFTSNRGGDWGLWSVSAEGGEPRRISLGTAAITKVGGAGEGRLAAEIYQARSDLRWLDEEAALNSITADVWSLSMGPRGQVAFVSNEGGGVDLWLTDGGQVRRLTALGSSYVHGPVWNPSGDTLTFVAIVERTPQIYTVRADGGAPVQLTRDAGDKSHPVYLPGSPRMVYLGRTASGWRIMELDTKTGAVRALTALGDGWESLSAGLNRLAGYRMGDPWLYRLDLRDNDVTAVRTSIRRPQGPYAVVEDGIVQIFGGQLIRTGWDGAERVVAQLPAGRTPPAEIEVDERSGRILLLDRSGNEANIALMTLKRN